MTINEMLERGLRRARPVAACRVSGKLSTFPYRIQKKGCGMRLFVGLDVSLAKTAIYVISKHGKIAKEALTAVNLKNCCVGPGNRRALLPPSGSRLIPCRSDCTGG